MQKILESVLFNEKALLENKKTIIAKIFSTLGNKEKDNFIQIGIEILLDEEYRKVNK